MIKEYLKDGGITMSNTSDRNILYLDYKTSANTAPNFNTSSMATSTSNIIKNRTFIVESNLYPSNYRNKKQ